MAGPPEIVAAGQLEDMSQPGKQSWADTEPDLVHIIAADQDAAESSAQTRLPTSETEPLQSRLSRLSLSSGAAHPSGNEQNGEHEPTLFKEMDGNDSQEVPPSKPRHESIHDRRRREHEEYKQKRAADPAFVPNRGAFFMHDHRHSGAGANGFRPLAKGLNPGRNVVGGPFSPANRMFREPDVTNGLWKHDMHETLAADERPARREAGAKRGGGNAKGPVPSVKVAKPSTRGFRQDGVNHYTRLLTTGEIFPRIHLRSMGQATTGRRLQLRQHLFIPEYRPPMRRDRPLHIFIPGMDRRLIFPSRERSFIFEHRGGKAKNGFTRAAARSRRESAVNANVGLTSPSIFSSRQSSVAAHHRQPKSSMTSPFDPSPSDLQPPVRLPSTGLAAESNNTGYEIVISPGMPAVRLPVATDGLMPDPITSASTVAVDHPRPQRSVDIPALASFSRSSDTPTHSDHQPFHQQFPSYPSNHQQSLQPAPFFYPAQSNQATAVPVMHQLPHEAIHATSFQTAAGQNQPAAFYPQAQPYYYPVPNPAFTSPTYAAPPYTDQTTYYTTASAFSPIADLQPSNQAPRNIVAREVNGMVYYSDRNEADSPPRSATAAPAFVPETGPGMMYYQQQPVAIEPYQYGQFYPTVQPPHLDENGQQGPLIPGA